MTTIEKAANLEFFNACVNDLAEKLLHEDLGVSGGRTIDPNSSRLKKSAWVASLLATSEEDKYNETALAFGILAYINSKGTMNEGLYERYLYIILSRVGSLQSFNTVRRENVEVSFEESLIRSLDSVLGFELENDLRDYELDEDTVLSAFQKEVYQELIQGNDLAISGPTSSGKSFILKKYIKEKVSQGESFEGIYVVPTRALISEVSGELSEIHENIDARSGAYFDQTEEDDDENIFLVVTPERCLRLVDEETRSHISPDLIFFDEIQNIQQGERGVIFENIIQSLDRYWSDTQIIAAGPYLENPQEALTSLTDRDITTIKTAFTPVLQMKSILRFKKRENQPRSGRETDVILRSPTGDKVRFAIPELDSITYTDVNNNKKRSLEHIVREYGKGSQNLVYSSRKDYAEDRAGYIAGNRGFMTSSDRVSDLVEFLENSIHEDYLLNKCLKKGVAFHHGMVPKIAREEIQEIYSEKGGIDTIVCTSTLLEGVNLPAEKIFLVGASTGEGEMSDFDFQNLIGRVGRVDEKLYGSIYCIEAQDQEWVDERLDDTEPERVETATSKATSNPEELIKALGSDKIGNVEDGSLRYTSILIRGKFIKDDHNVNEYLKKKDFNDNEIEEAKGVLAEKLEDVEIPQKLLRRSPTVDPLQQDELYKSVKKNPEKWIIAENRYDYEYEKLLDVTRNLNQIFLFTRDNEEDIYPDNVETEHGEITPICITANKWLTGDPYKEMIEARQRSSSIQDNTVNDSIRNILELVNKDITFIMVKYFGILGEIFEEVDYEEGKWMIKFDQMLEMGSTNSSELELMSKGVDRSVAIDLGVPHHVDDVGEYLENKKRRIPSFYRTHLENQDVL